MRRAFFVLALIATAAAVADSDISPIQTGRDLTEKFYDNDIAALWSVMNRDMRRALGSMDRLQQFRDQVGGSLGAETAIISENVSEMPAQRLHVYTRHARFEHAPMPIVITFSFDIDGTVAGLFVQPQQQPAASPYLDYETKADLRLPFDGDWFVFWGGRSVEENYHAIVSDQRFAYDFLIMRDGRSFEGDGSELDDYYCWGEPILAPASGTVSSVVDGLPDMAPGDMDPLNPPGNHVFLDFGNDEYALFAHLMNGSVTVEAGDEVAPGDELGKCGNSGNTSEPHLHFHIQDSPRFGQGDGKPAFFNDYLSSGEPVERGEPRRGETVSPAD